MINIKIAEIAKINGLNNAYALQKALKCSPTMASRLWKGEFKQIGIETVDSLCELFACFPSDLIVFTSKTDSGKLAVEKPARKPSTANITDLLSLPQVAERLGKSRKRVNDYVNSGNLPATKNSRGHNFVRLEDLLIFQTVYLSES
jgi:DNA-binding Xre family transcriptional regulator/predicted DNA-binding transcriptional regulator AlpA